MWGTINKNYEDIIDQIIVSLYRIIYRIIMKVTAIIPDEIIKDVQSYTQGKNITDSLIKALQDWLYKKRIEKLNREIGKKPLQFADGFSAEKIRKLSDRL